MEQPSLFDLSEYVQEQPASTPELDMLGSYLGEEKAAVVVAALGGLQLRVPSTHSGERWTQLTESLGLELAEEIVRIFGGEELYIPRNYHVEKAEQHKAIRSQYLQLIRKGYSNTRAIQEVARNMQISDRHVRRITALG